MQSPSTSHRRSSSLSYYPYTEKSAISNSLGASSPRLRHLPLGRDGEKRTPEHGAPQIAARSDRAMKPTKTPAERTRELSILSDPLANLLSPDYVECKQCKKKIKLSSKSAYDTFHWRNHRKRCIKSFKKKGKQPQTTGAVTPSLVLSHTNFVRNTKPPKSPSTLVTSRSPKTPPLISDDEEDHRSELSSEAQSPLMASHPMPPSQSPPSARYYDYNVQDYLGRSHPGYVPRQPARHSWCTSTGASLQNWSWSQLKPSRFDTAKHNSGGDGEDDDLSIEGSFDSFGDERVQEAARTLSMLSRAR